MHSCNTIITIVYCSILVIARSSIDYLLKSNPQTQNKWPKTLLHYSSVILVLYRSNVSDHFSINISITYPIFLRYCHPIEVVVLMSCIMISRSNFHRKKLTIHQIVQHFMPNPFLLMRFISLAKRYFDSMKSHADFCYHCVTRVVSGPKA